MSIIYNLLSINEAYILYVKILIHFTKLTILTGSPCKVETINLQFVMKMFTNKHL